MHIARNGDLSYAVGVKIDSALQVLAALDYAVPQAGPLVMPSYAMPPGVPGTTTGGGRDGTVKTATPAAPCAQGCEATLGSLNGLSIP